MFKPKPSDYHPHEAYSEEFVKNYFSTCLVTFAYINFKKVKRIEQFDALKDFVKSGDYTNHQKSINFFQQYDCLANTLIDSILISISFENYCKAKLLLNDFVIHEIDPNKNKELFKKQKNEPILKNDLTYDRELKKFIELKNKTINYSLLLGVKEYNKYYNFNEDIIETLKEFNDNRNNLHLYMSETPKLSNKEIDKLQNLKEIVEIDFAALNNALIDKMGGESRTRIPIKI